MGSFHLQIFLPLLKLNCRTPKTKCSHVTVIFKITNENITNEKLTSH